MHPFLNYSWMSDAVKTKISCFYDHLVEANKLQNLTRLITPSDFFTGHFLDVLELMHTRWLHGVCFDLGSGAGIPGLLASILEPSFLTEATWVLAESEARKAIYLQGAVDLLNLPVQVYMGRAESYLKCYPVDCIAVRAVGTLSKLYPWIRAGIWKELILFKGPAWEKEWELFQKSRFASELRLLQEHHYSIPSQDTLKTRLLLKLVKS